MCDKFITFFDNENIYSFLMITICIAMVFHRTCSLANMRYLGRSFLIRHGLIELVFGVVVTTLLSILGVISPITTFYQKKIFLSNGCQDLPGCMKEKGVYYIPGVTIQYAKDPDFYRLRYSYKDKVTRRSLSADITYNKKFILGWEEND